MTERAYITVDRAESPRIVEVAEPGAGGSDDLIIQDLHDTLNSNTLPAGDPDDSLDNMDEPFLLDSQGKAVLSSTLNTGITAVLQNGQLAFEGNYTTAQIGTATSVDATGTSLTDLSAAFQANGVKRGAVIINFDDRSVTEVLRVNSENQLDHRILQAGIANDWTIGDNYAIFNVIQKSVGSGNVVAVDTDGVTPIDAIFPTFATQVVVEKDTSAAQVAAAGLTPSQQQIRDAQKLAPSGGVPATGSVDELLLSNPANVVAALGAELYDNVAYKDVIVILLAMANGRIKENPIGSKIFEVYEQDGTTILYKFQKTTDERVPIP